MQATAQKSVYDFDISLQPDYALLSVQLKAGEQIFAEPSSMASMDENIHLKAGLKGGMFKSVKRMFGGESMVVNTFTAQNTGGEVTFAPGPMGDLHHYHLDGTGIMLERGAFVAHSPGVDLDAKFQGLKGFFSGEGLMMLKASGTGDIFFNTYGAAIEVDVSGDYVVDTGYVLAFEDTLNYRISTLSGLTPGQSVKSFFFGGEGLVCNFSGQGKLWVQTRALAPYLRWVHPYRRTKKSNNN